MFLKNVLLWLTFLFVATNTWSQYKISGTIIDSKTKDTLVGVYVYLPDLKTGALSDEKGYFTIKDLRKGTYLLEFTYSGYKNTTTKIDLKNDTIISISLSPSVTELNEVVITGSTKANNIKRNPIIITTLDKATLNQNASTNIIDALKEVPGVSQITTGPNISKPVIRGLGYNRIITLNNGIKQEGQQWGDEHGIEIDEYSIDRAEIIKGPGSLLYGSDGIAGVLNFLPPKPPFNGTVKSQVVANYQTNNNLLGYSVANMGNKNGFQWLARFSNKYAGNYHNKYDGIVFNSGSKEIDGNVSLGLTKRWGHTTLSLSSYNTKLGIIEGERDSLGKFTFVNSQGIEKETTTQELKGYNQIFNPYQKVNHLNIASNSIFIIGKGSINVEIGFQSNKRQEFEDAENPNQVGLSLLLNTLNYNIRYNLQRMKGWETTIGIGGMQQSNGNKGSEFLIPDYSLFDIGAFVFTQKTINKLTLAGGLRFDNRYLNSKNLFLNQQEEPVVQGVNGATEKFKSFIKNYNGLSGSIGLTYELSKISDLKFNVSNGFRAPNIAELASNGKHEGTFRYEIGNSNLKSEFSHQIDLEYSLHSEHITLIVSPFLNYISNYSYLQKLKDKNGNDIYPDSSDLSPAYQYKSGNAILWGGEIYFDYHPHPLDWLHIENSFSYVRGMRPNQPDSTKNLPFIPAPHYRGGLKAEFGDWGKNVSNFYVKFNVDYYFPQNMIFSAYGTETKTPGYILLSSGIGAEFNLLHRKNFINLFFSADNLTNIAYQNHLSRLKYAGINELTGRMGVFNMGRNFSLKMIINI